MPALDPHAGSPDLSGPCSRTIDVDAGKSDTDDLPYVVRVILVGVGGTLRFTDRVGNVRTVTVADGEKFDAFYVRRVHATGTTATGLLGGV